jgi:hypothetical protein
MRRQGQARSGVTGVDFAEARRRRLMVYRGV